MVVMLVCMSFVCSVFMSKMTCSQCSDEKGETYKHKDSFPTEMSLCRTLAFVYHITVMTVGFHSAVGMVMLTAAFCMHSSMEQVDDDADYYSQSEEDCEKEQGLLRNHRKHDEGLVS